MKNLKNKKKKTKKWILPRHVFIRNVADIIYGTHVRRKYNVKIKPFTEQGDRNYLVLYNHQTAADQFFVGMAFRGAVYYLASEDIFSLGFLSKLLRFAVNPIPIKKQTNDPRAVINCIKVAKEGGTIAIAPEGNRTYAGRLMYIKPSIAQLAKHLKLPIAIFQIENGYGVHPRWSDEVRRGTMTAGVSRVIEVDEMLSLSDEELCALIERELNVNEERTDRIYEGRHLAEYIERAMYVCPRCGLSRFESHGDTTECKRCSMKIKHLPTTELVSEDEAFRFKFAAEWYEYQCSYINALDTTKNLAEPIYEDTAALYEVILYKNKKILEKSSDIKLYGDRMSVSTGDGELLIPFAEASALAVLGKNKLNVYFGDKVYQIKGDERFNALKYVNLYYRYQQISKGDCDDKFLGL